MTKPWKRWGPPKPRPPAPVLPTVEAYARWADSYPPHAHNALMRAEETGMRALLPAVKGLIVLDLACGTGRWGLIVLQDGAARAIGLDISAEMLARCELAERALAGIECLPLADESVDVVLCGLALGHEATLAAPLNEIARVLRPGGTAVISDVHPILALNGAQRTFTDSQGNTYAVQHTAHLAADYWKAAQAAGLELTGIEEPRLSAEDARRAPQPNCPVALVLRFEKLR